MQAMASVISTIITLGLNWAIGKFGGFAAMAILVAACVSGTFIALFLKEQLNKTNRKRMLSSGSICVALVTKEIV